MQVFKLKLRLIRVISAIMYGSMKTIMQTLPMRAIILIRAAD